MLEENQPPKKATQNSTPNESTFKNEEEIIIFSDKENWEFIAGKPTLQELLKKVVQAEGIWYQRKTKIYTKKWN